MDGNSTANAAARNHPLWSIRLHCQKSLKSNNAISVDRLSDLEANIKEIIELQKELK